MPLTEGSRRQGMPLTEGSRRQEMPLTFEPDTKCCHITQGATMVRLWGPWCAESWEPPNPYALWQCHHEQGVL